MNVEQFAEENGVIFEDDYLDEEPDEEIICEIVKELLADNEQAE
ncbi:MAG: hypothetical protein ABS987_11975 [Ruminococcus sp.]